VKHVGTAGDTPVPGHYDADSYVDPAVFNAGVWKIDSTFGQGSLITSNFGTAGDIAVPGDYDADGMVNLAVFRLSTGTWYVGDPTGQSFTVTSFGVSTDKPVPADYDGDGKVDVAIFRNGIWWVNNSRLGLSSVAFGFTTDTAVENCYID
jgi:putative transposon-encoded protein